MNEFITTGDFCLISTDRLVHEGFKRGQYVYVVGVKPLPVDSADPYIQRLYVFAQKVTKDGHIEDSGNDKLFHMDPRDLSKVGKNRQKKFVKLMVGDFPMPQQVTSDSEVLISESSD